MATTETEALLKQLLAEPPRQVASEAFYCPEGDCVFFHAEGGEYDGVRVDGLLTVYQRASDHKVIGFQLKGVKALLGEVMRAVTSATNTVELTALLIAALTRATRDPKQIESQPDESARFRAYYESVQRSGTQGLPIDEIRRAA